MADVFSAERTQTGSTPLRLYPTDRHGKLRVVRGSYTNDTGGTLADGTVIEMCRLPGGRIRILPWLSAYSVSALGASRTLDIGHQAYEKADNVTEAADPDDLVDGDDVSSAVVAESLGTDLTTDYYSKSGINIDFLVQGGTIPADATFEIVLVYVQD